MSGNMAESMPEPAGSMVIELDPPIEVGGGKWDRLILREPTAGEVMRAEAEMKGAVTADGVRRYQIALLSAVAGVDRRVIERLPISRLNEGWQFLAGFIEAGLKTGAI